MRIPMNSRSARLTATVVVLAALAEGTHGQTTAAVAAEIGLTPQSVVVASLHDQATVLLQRIEDAVEIRLLLADVHEDADQAGELVTILGAALAASPTDPAIQQQYETADAALDALRGQIDSARQALFDIATQGFAPNHLQALDNWRQTTAFRLQPGFRAAQRSPEQWKRIERVLRAEARSARTGEPMTADDVLMLAEIRAELVVAEAGQRLTLFLPEVKQAFDEYDMP